MAAGCAVVASDLEAFAAVVDAQSDTPAGLLFPIGDADGLARQVQLLIDDPRTRNTLITAGKRRAALYDWERVASQVLAVYETVATGQIVTVSK